MSSKEESKKKVSNSKNAVQKSDRAIDSPLSPAGKMVHEQLGLYVYPEKEKKASTLEVKKSDHPKISKFNDIDPI